MNEQDISTMLPTHMLSGETSLEESAVQRNSTPSSPITKTSDQVFGEQVTEAAAGTEVVEPNIQGQDSDEYDDAASEWTGNDSAIAGIGGYTTSTYTVDSAVIEKVVENGRTYHSYKDGKYALPNDEAELNRLDIQHKMWLITLDEKLHLAPIDPNPQNVLDMATGTGIWAIDFARVFRVPPNCQFEIDDVEDEWIFPFKFDYIHGRSLATCFKDPQSVIAKAYDALLPGGWFELQDVCLQSSEDGSHCGTSLEEVQKYVSEATTESGRRWDNVPNYKRWMIEQGFEDVCEFHYRWPTNSQWPKKLKEKILGAWFQAQVESGMLEAAVTRLFMMKLGWSREELITFLSVVRKDLRDPRIKAYSPMMVVYGRKPKTQ